MSLHLHPAPDGAHLRLLGELTIEHSAEARDQLFSQPGALIDLSGVTDLDSCGLQLLLVARRDAGVHLIAPSAAVGEVLRLTGLSHLIEEAP